MVAPETTPPLVRLAPFFCHWYVGATGAVADAVKLTVTPGETTWVAGWTVNTGPVLNLLL